MVGALLVGACASSRPPGTTPPVDSFQLAVGGRPQTAALRPRLARPPTPPPAFDDPRRRARLRRALPVAEKLIADHVHDESIPALAAGVVLDDELVFAKGWGTRGPNGQPVDGETIFRIGAITKAVTAMAILDLVADGAIALDDPAAAHLPELGGLLYPSLDAGVVTIRQLLTHTSGLPRSRDLAGLGAYPSEDEVLTRLDGLALEHPPGTTVAYSNLGVGLLGMIVARASGKPLRDYVRDNLLAPLDIDDMAWDAGDVPLDRLAPGRGTDGQPLATAQHERIGPLEGSGGLYGSVTSLAKLASSQLAAWPARSDPEGGPVPRRLLRESHRMQAFEALAVRRGKTTEGRASGTGLAWQVRQSCAFEHLVWHNGSIDGYRSALFMLPRRGIAVIVLATAADDVSPLADELLATLVREARLPARRAHPSPALEVALAEIERMFELGNVNEPTYQRLFAASFRNRTSLTALRRMLADERARHGSCTLDQIRPAGPSDADASLSCERDSLSLHVRLATADPRHVDQLHTDSRAPEPPGRRRCR